MFKNLKVWQKLSLVGALLSVPIITLVYLFIQTQNKQIAVSANARDGVEMIAPIRALLEQLPQHRGVLNGVLNGEESLKAQLPSIESKIEASIAAVDAATAKYGERIAASEGWEKFKTQWHDVQQKSATMTPKDSFDTHTRLIGDVIGLIQNVGDRSQLILDTELDSYYVADMVLTKLNWETEYLGQLRGYGAGVAAKGKMTPEEHARLMFITTQIQGSVQDLERSVKSAIRYNPALEAKLGGLVNGAVTSADGFLNLFQSFMNSLLAQSGPRSNQRL